MPSSDTDSSRLALFAERRPVALFFTLAIATSWTVWIPTLSVLPHGNVRLLAIVPGAFGPLVAAATVTMLRGESARQWLVGALAWRRSARWYAVAVAVPLIVSVVLLGTLVGLTGSLDLTAGPEVAALLGFNLVFASLLGGGQEEFGWRGFALPHLQARYDALTASLLIGVVWAIWHAPMFVFGVYSENPVLYVLGILAFAVVLTWYYNSSRGQLLGAVVMHGTHNAAVNVPPMLVEGANTVAVPYEGLLAAVYWVVALVLLGRYGRTTLSSEAPVEPTWANQRGDEPTAQPSSTFGSDD
ncbi:CPBP family intramembrane glutamic endopeptidase [Haloarcula salinisoli]|uniref:CPBP family intramembrane metalloprotease n=1 Tax=Haloarcula salinisoli TaxID=2487746 RepID=A0A8J7YMU4_9EURY|nr:type II CAAX endopeptidase family protein [Halomicroarcula salinisoli]MBX0287717.1 CPBP family intramembrane metalloprotease [Halomicroarcula salinisoli]MBX0304641.1 CPBP family intramembrane metalloprotease [Halomicroarcula salinisoli]